MGKLFTCLLVLVCLIFNVHAQKDGSVQGVAFDTLHKQSVPGATVTLLKQKDSSLVSFSLTDDKGTFELTNIASGQYRLMITHINYRTRNKLFTISAENTNIKLGQVIMHDVSTMLEEVVVTSEAPPVTLVGDTVQYNAGSFKTQPNASVEDLLKKLPGVQVDKDGNIKAQGEKVRKVLVDGKEFFGNDPKIATRNLPADAIDKVDVYDKQSDHAQLTGFDDGSGEKTIDLKLKKDRKGGMFGKITAGAGTNERYEGKFNVNAFKGARQLSAIGMGNNTNAEGFSFIDMLNFSGGLGQLQNGETLTISSSNPMASMLASSANSGVNTTSGSGFNYNDIIGTKTDLRSNYFYSRFNPYTESRTERQYFLPDSSYLYRANSSSNNLSNSHRLNLIADIQIDSFNSIKISPSFGTQNTFTNSYSNYQTLSQAGDVSNAGFSKNVSENNGYNFQNEILFRKKFRRRGRTFSLNLQTNFNESNGNENQQSITTFYSKVNTVIQNDSIYRQSHLNGDMSSYNAKWIYTEPIFKRSLLEVSLSKSNSKNTSDKTTYDYNTANGKYNLLNPQLTNNFDNTYGYITQGLRIRTQRKRYFYSYGTSWQNAALQGNIKTGIKDSVIKKTFANVLPTAQFQYNLARYKKLTLYYSTYIRQPSVTQLQPIPDVSNPLSIKEGNPFLKQEYTHSLRLGYTAINIYKNKNAFININAFETQNKIVNYDVLDSLGVQHSRPVNVNGVYNITGSLSYGLPVRALKGTLNISSNIAVNKGKQFINTIANDITTTTVAPVIRFDINPSENLNLVLNAEVNYNSSVYSLRRSLNATYVNQNYGAEISGKLPAGFFFTTDFSYIINSRRVTGFNNHVPLWNATISRMFLKNNRTELKLRVFDMLNCNTNITRSTNMNYIEDISVNTLRRYFLLSFTYSLNKSGLGNGGAKNGIQIRM